MDSTDEGQLIEDGLMTSVLEADRANLVHGKGSSPWDVQAEAEAASAVDSAVASQAEAASVAGFPAEAAAGLGEAVSGDSGDSVAVARAALLPSADPPVAVATASSVACCSETSWAALAEAAAIPHLNKTPIVPSRNGLTAKTAAPLPKRDALRVASSP